MNYYSDIFFWLGGVLTESLPELNKAALFPEAGGHEAVRKQQLIRDLIEDLSLGKISPQEYSKQAIARCGAGMKSSNLEQLVLDLATLRQPVADIVERIPEAYERWLIIDYPVNWFKELADRLKLYSLFPENRTIFTAKFKIQRMVPEVFYFLPSNAGRAMKDCIVIDPISARAVEAMKHGLATIIYVYPERLKHEFAMQGIWQTDTEVIHPSSSERVSI